MADKTIPQLPNLLPSGVTPNDLLVIVNYDLPSGTTKNIKAFDLQSYINSGVISLTGSTYNPTTGVLSFTNSTGGTVTISGFTTSGSTGGFLTGPTYNSSNGTLSFTNGSGGTITVSGFTTGSTLYEVGTGINSTQRIGVSSDASGNWSLVSGGKRNSASGGYSVTVGGKGNCAEKDFSFVGGGTKNIAAGCL
jgi:hypothetical protein